MDKNTRLIDANALVLDNEQYFCKPCKEKGHDYHEVACRACWVDNMRIAIEDAPTVDAVEVVRCGECRKCVEGHCCRPLGGGSYVPFPMKPDDFCSYGERKDNDEFL